MADIVDPDNYQTTPPCADCVHYEPCKRHSQQLAAVSGDPSYDAEPAMASGDGICDMFLERRKLVATYDKQSPKLEPLNNFHDIGMYTAISERVAVYVCSTCGTPGSLVNSYCPHCGAKILNTAEE